MYSNDDGFFRALRSVVKNMHALGDASMARFGLTHAEAGLLLLLYAEGREGCSQDTLAVSQVVDRTNIGRSLKKLEARGYVRRERLDDDRRANWVYVTEAGMGLKDEILSIKSSIEARVRQGVSSDDYLRLAEALRVIDRNLGTIG